MKATHRKINRVGYRPTVQHGPDYSFVFSSDIRLWQNVKRKIKRAQQNETEAETAN